MELKGYADITECLKSASGGKKGIFIAYSENEIHKISYHDLWVRSCYFSAKMYQSKVQHQEKVFIHCLKLESLVYAIWTCAVGGYIAVPIAYTQKTVDWRRFDQYKEACLITDMPEENNGMFSQVFDISGIESQVCPDIADIGVSYSQEDVFCIQFSSGTTGTSKGIPIKRKNISANLKDEIECFEVKETDIVLNWEPLTHSGGLIIFHLMAVMVNLDQYLIPENIYVKNPLLWMNLIDKFKATITGTVPFALRHFMAFMDNSSEKINWELSCLRVMTMGAEHVGIDLFRKFVSEMEPYHLKKGAVIPTYGLSEATCLIGYGVNNGSLDTYMTETKEFVYGGKVIKSTDSKYMPEYISYRYLGTSTQFKILDDNNNQLSLGEIGNIWIKGPSVIDGYMKDGGIDASSFREGWINTGDLGALIHPRELAVMGRSKEIVILGGENYECAALEKLATSISKENGFLEAIVCNIMEEDGLEFVGVFVLCQEDKEDAQFLQRFSKLQRNIRDGLYQEFNIVTEVIVPIKEIPRSGSGKIRRVDLAANYKSKEYGVMEEFAGREVKAENKLEKGDTAARIVSMIHRLFQIEISDLNKNFREYGIVSVNIPVLVNEVNKEFGTDIKVTSVFNYPELSSFIQYVSKMADSANGSVDQGEKNESGVWAEDEIAIVGMSCRFPKGANNPQEYWNLLFQGMDAMVDIPKERWDLEKYYSEDKEEAGKMYCKKGGFLNVPVDEFDAKFFNISPKEAVELDPHQRMLLELTWEAFENGGMDITKYAGSRTGVYLGIASNDYGLATVSSGDLERIGAYSLTGVCDSTACGRLSYTFGFEGPCFSVDTACSSSLTALHLACNSIKNDDADVAVVGGCSLMLTPTISIAFSKLKATSVDGHSKSFDASADGYGRGEGGGVIVLKRLSEAIEDHDNILGIVRGSGLNQDGKSNGLTAPNGESQKKLIVQTLQKYNIAPEDVSYIETHGTGTVLGDPIEVNSLIEAYCQKREAHHTLKIGSVKSNIGHLEAASGMASIIKVLLAMKKNIIPRNINFNKPNPHIAWENSGIEVISNNLEWKREGHKPRLAGIDSFGFGGSNAHVVLMDYADDEVCKKIEDKKAYILKISAKTQNSLKTLLNNYVGVLENAAESNIDDILYTANRGRADFNYRVAFTAKNRDELVKKMYGYLQGEKISGVYSSVDSALTAKKIAFMYTGQGSQYIGMGKTLYETNLTFRASMDLCDHLFRPYQLKSILNLIYSDNAKEEVVNNTAIAQSLIFAIEYSLGEMWKAYGVKPQIVLGHSIGEFAAAVMAGIFSLEAAVELVACRGRLMADAPGHGTMVTIFADKKRVGQLIGTKNNVVIAVQNAKDNCVISGEYEAVMEICAMAEELGIRVRQLKVSHAFHSPLMKGAAEEFKQIAGRVEFHSSKLDFISSMYARKIEESEILDAEYWSQHIINPVNFYETMENAGDDGNVLFLEIGAAHTLASICRLTYDEDRMYCSSLDRATDDQKEVANAVAYMYARGIDINWNTYYFGQDTKWRRQNMLPNYPFERSSYWQEILYDRRETKCLGAGERSSLLGQKIETAFLKDTVIFQKTYKENLPYFMGEHIIYDTVIAPAASYVSILISVMKEIRNPKSISIEDIELREPLVINEGEERLVQVCITEAYGEACYFEIVSKLQESSDDEWIMHSKGKIRVSEDDYLLPKEEGHVNEWKNLDFDEEKTDPTEHSVYAAMTVGGFNLGEGFCRLGRSLCGEDKGICEINPSHDLKYEEDYIIYPGIIDSVFHTMLCIILQDGFTFDGSRDITLIPYYISRISYNYVESDKLWCRTDSHVEGQSFIGGTDVFNENNEMVIQIDNMITRLTNEKSLLGSNRNSGKMLYHYDWSKNSGLQIAKRAYDKVYLVIDAEKDLDILQLELQKRRFEFQVLLSHDVNYKLGTIINDARESNHKLMFLYASGAESKASGMNVDILKSLVEMVQEINRMNASEFCCIKILTQKVISFMNNENINIAQSVLWGFAKTMGMEFEKLYGGIVDIDDFNNLSNISKLLDIILYGSSYEICIRNEVIYTSRIYKHSEYIRHTNAKREAITVSEESAYVIAGGTGFLGMTYLEALANLGAKHIAVLCRRNPDQEYKKSIDELQKEHGMTIRLYLTDICDFSRLDETIQTIKSEMPQIRGIINASGVIRDKMIQDMSWEDYEYVLEPKTIGNLNLYRSVEGLELDFFIMLSSITAVMGNVGQSNYAAANYFINTFAEYLQSAGKNGFAFCWGPWSAQGMAASDIIIKNMERMGIEAFSKEQGRQLIEEFFANPYHVLMIANIKWDKFISNASGQAVRELLIGMGTTGKDGKKQSAESNRLDLTGVSAKEATGLVETRIKASCMNIMGYDRPELVDSDATFSELGANSLMMFSIRSEINKMLKIDLNVSFLYTYPTVSKLVHYLVYDMLGMK